MNLNPKIRAALVAALVAAAVNVVAVLADAYPDDPLVATLVAVVTALAPVVAGYAKPQGDWQPKP